MALDKKQTQNIITIVLGAMAVILATIVILVKTGVFKPAEKDNTTTDGTIIETEVVVVSEIDEDGNVKYVTMLEYYVRPSISSNHRYPSTTKKHTTEPSTEKYYVEMSETELVTDENGEPVTDENGETKINVVTYTVETDEKGNKIENGTTAPSTTEPTTETTTEYVQKTTYVVKTDPVFKRPIRDIRGNEITELVTLDMPPTTTTTKPSTTKPSTTKASTTKPSTTKQPESSTLQSGEAGRIEPVTQPSSENVTAQ